MKSEEMTWEYEAKQAIREAMSSLKFNSKKGVVILSSVSNHDGRTYEEEFYSFDDLWSHVVQVGEEAWCGAAPYDGGEPVFEPDVDDWVAAAFERRKVEEFFARQRDLPRPLSAH